MNIDPVNVEAITFSIEILGRKMKAAWGKHNQMLAIEGVEHYADALDLLSKIRSAPKLSLGGEPSVVSYINPGLALQIQNPGLASQTVTMSKEQFIEMSTSVASTKAPVETPKEPGDDSVFMAMESLKEVVKEMVRRGHKNMDAVSAAVQELADSGSCPLLMRLGSNLSERLVATCNALRIPGTVAAG